MIGIDAFAGSGVHQRRNGETYVPGSPLNALYVQPPFWQLHRIDMKRGRVDQLRRLVGDQHDSVHFYEGDSNKILIETVFPQVRRADYRRALCLLDPYGLTLNWEVVRKAAEMQTIEVFINFPIMDINRNALWHHPERVSAHRRDRLTRFWGDTTWQQAAYVQQPTLFGDEVSLKQPNSVVTEAYRTRLQQVAGFAHVPEPIPMRNRQNAIVYYLFFASQNETGAKIARHLFKRYRDWRMRADGE